MSEKYQERSVVLLKREIENLSKNVHTLLGNIEDLKRQEAKEYNLLEEKRQMVRDYDNVFAAHFDRLKKEERALVENIALLKNQATITIKDIVLIRESVASIEIQEPDFSFAEQVADLLQKKIEGLESLYESGTTKKDAIEETVARLEKEAASLKEEKTLLEPELENLRSEIFLGNDKNGRLGMEYLRLEEKMASLKRREHDVTIMQKRLLPEYKDMLSDKLCKKCGNII